MMFLVNLLSVAMPFTLCKAAAAMLTRPNVQVVLVMVLTSGYCHASTAWMWNCLASRKHVREVLLSNQHNYSVRQIQLQPPVLQDMRCLHSRFVGQ